MDHQATLRTYRNTNLPQGTPERPLVTFALFAYNQEKYIREAVEGAFAQTYDPLEIILSDDCSTDRTFEIMTEMAAAYNGSHLLKVRRNSANLGLAGHINEVISLSSGEIISWAAGDDIPCPNRTKVFVSHLLSDERNVGVHSNVEEIDINGRHLRYRLHSLSGASFRIESVADLGLSVITQSHAFRRWIFDFYGPFLSDLTQEGIAMAFREAALGEIVFVEECLTKYRVGSGISTYSGRDIYKIKTTEPIKYVDWYISAFRQMLCDSEKLVCFPSGVLDSIKTNMAFYSNLQKINSGGQMLLPLINNLFIKPSDTRSIRAIMRRVTPDRVYHQLIRR